MVKGLCRATRVPYEKQVLERSATRILQLCLDNIKQVNDDLWKRVTDGICDGEEKKHDCLKNDGHPVLQRGFSVEPKDAKITFII